MGLVLYPILALRHVFRVACFSALLIFLIAAAARADCRCVIQSASSSLSFEGRALPASLPCGARILASDKGELELTNGMRLSLTAGASFALPAAVCAKESGETHSSTVTGVVRLLSSTAQTVSLRDSVPAGLRGLHDEEAGTALALILRVEGTVELRGKGEPPMPARSDMTLVEGETIRTGTDGFAELVLSDGSRVLIGSKQNFDPRALLR